MVRKQRQKIFGIFCQTGCNNTEEFNRGQSYNGKDRLVEEEVKEVGHNNPPDTSLMGLDELNEYLLAEFRNLNLRTGEITVTADDADKLKISTEIKAERVASFIKQINITKKKADVLRENIRAPYSECASAVQGKYKEIEESLDGAKDKAVIQLLAWLQMKIDIGEDPHVRSDYGQTAFIRETLEIKIVDITKVPSEYLKVDEAKVKKDYKKSGITTPGLLIKTIKKLGVK